MNNTSLIEVDGCGRLLTPPGDPLIPNDYHVTLVISVCYPFFFFLCTIGNILNILILKNNRPKTTADVYMCSLAVSDLCILWLFIPEWIQRIGPATLFKNSQFLAFDKVYLGLYPGLTSIFYFVSNWTVVIFSVERLLVVANPILFLGRLNVKTSILAVLAILLVGFVKSLQVFLDYFYWRSTQKPAKFWIAIRSNKYPWLAIWEPVQSVATVVDPILVFCALIITNSLLVQQLFRHRKTRQSLRSARGKPENCRYAVILSMGCAISFLICKTPSFLYYALQLASRPPYCTYRISHYAELHWRAVIWFFSTVNYTINFYLYCAISQKFRRQLKTKFPVVTSSIKRLCSCSTRSRGDSSRDLAAAQSSSLETQTTEFHSDFS